MLKRGFGEALVLAGALAGFLAGAALCRAQSPEQPTGVYLNVSIDAVNRLQAVDALLRDEQWSDAVDLLQQLIEKYPDKVVPIGPKPATSHVDLRSYCHHRISRLPPPALALYRQRVDSQAEALFAQAQQTGNRDLLERIVDELFCSSVADSALERLGDQALSGGHPVEAQDRWQCLLPDAFLGRELDGERTDLVLPLRYPDPDTDTARIAAKWIVASMLAGNREQAQEARNAFRQLYPKAAGRLAGQQGPYEKILEQLAQEPSSFDLPSDNTQWPTFAGNFRRSRVLPEALDVGDLQWKWEVAVEQQRWTPAGRAPTNYDSHREAQRQLVYHPIVVGKTVHLATEENLWSFNLETGSADSWFALDETRTASRNGLGAPLRQTMTVVGQRLLVRAGGSVYRRSFGIQMPRTQFTQPSKLYCLDLATLRLLWDVSSARLADLGTVFEGAPVADQDSVYIAMTRQDTLSETSVACLDLETGQPRWREVVCESSNELDRHDVSGPMHNLLTLVDNTIYYATNLGTVAAINARTGHLRWVTTYVRQRPVHRTEWSAQAPDLNPPVYSDGKLFVSASDTAKIQCLDTQNGRLLWEAYPSATHILGVAKGTLIATGNRVWAIDINTGKVRWYWPENTVPGYGRGLLAGNNVYWPTLREIHVLDVQTGRKARPSIPLYERLGVKAGNLVAADGYLIIAQPTRLLVFSPYHRLIKQLREQLVSDPKSGGLHYQLARAAFDHGEHELAAKHFALAAREALPEQTHEGEKLADLAQRRYFDSLFGQVDTACREQRLEDADRLLEQVVAEAPDPVSRLKATRKRAAMWSDAKQSERALLVYQTLLERADLRSLLVDRPDGVKLPAATWASEQQQDLLARHGREIYARLDNAARRLLGDTDDPEVLQKTADRFPHAQVLAELLLRAAQRFRERGQLLQARQAYRRLLRGQHGSPAVRLRCLEDLYRVYRAQQRWSAAAMVLDQLTEAVADPAVPRATAQRLRRLVADEWPELDHRVRQPEAVPSRLVAFRRAWSTRRSSVGYYVPKGPAPTPAAHCVYSVSRGHLEQLAASDGSRVWRCDLVGWPVQLANGPAGLVVGTPSRLSCHAYDSGRLLWEQFCRPSEWPAGTTSTGLTEDKDAFCKIVCAGDLLIAWGHRGHLSAITGDDGTIAWQVDLGTPPLSVALHGTAVVCRIPGEYCVLDVFTGRQRFAIPTRGFAAELPTVRIGQRLFLVPNREEIAAVDVWTGTEAWRRAVDSSSLALPRLLATEQTLLALLDGCRLIRLEPASGQTLWSVPVESRPRPTAAMSLTDAGILHLRQDWLEFRETASGRLRWREPLPEGVTPWSIHNLGETICVLGAPRPDASQLRVYQGKTGRLSQVLQFPDSDARPSLGWTGDRGLISGNERSWVLAVDQRLFTDDRTMNKGRPNDG